MIVTSGCRGHPYRRRFLASVGTFAGLLDFLLRGPLGRLAAPGFDLFGSRLLARSVIAPAARLSLVEQGSQCDAAAGLEAPPYVPGIAFVVAVGSRSPSELRINELREGRWLYMTILSGG
jgi:hypothetical protein